MTVVSAYAYILYRKMDRWIDSQRGRWMDNKDMIIRIVIYIVLVYR